MTEYIEREKAFDAVFGQFCASSDETEAALNAAIEEIRVIPAADVRPVVTCGECKYRHNIWRQGCQGRGADWFCADGERREQIGKK